MNAGESVRVGSGQGHKEERTEAIVTDTILLYFLVQIMDLGKEATWENKCRFKVNSPAERWFPIHL